MRRAQLGALVAVLAACSGITGAAPDPAPLRVVVFGDFNGPYGSTTYSPLVTQIVRRIADEWRPDIVVLPGDLVAGQSRALPDARFPAMWRAFDRAVAAPLRRAGIPLGVALGNHDASAARTASGGYLFARERRAAAEYWRDPAHRPSLDYHDAAHFPFYYSFLIRGVFVLVVDATSHVIQDAPWVQAALQSKDARAAGMRIVMGHLPLYGISEGRSRFGEVVQGGDEWRRRFEAGGVDLYVSGHHAAYYPAQRGRLRLLHAGGIGARRYVGHPEVPSRSTVTLMEIDVRTREIRLETVDAATGKPISLGQLPRCVNGYNGPVFRIDLPQSPDCAPPR